MKLTTHHSPLSFSRTRIAPTPSGFLHPGNLLSFSITCYLAERTGARILLRIDDLDQERVRDAYLKDIFETLEFLDIPFDEGPRDLRSFKEHYSQQLRLARYEGVLERLRDHVFACRCSRKATDCSCEQIPIALDEPGVTWKLKTNIPDEILMKSLNTDLRCNATAHEFPAGMKNFVVRKKNGLPSYQVASIADDLDYGIDLVVRGADLFDSSVAQLRLAALLDETAFGDACFFHHGLVNVQGLKLSKSAGSASASPLRSNARDPKEVFRKTALLAGLEGEPGSWRELAVSYFSKY